VLFLLVIERQAAIDTVASRVPHPDTPSTLTRDQVMTAAEVADLLHMPVSTVYYLASRGELPARRLGRTWRFLRARIEEYLWS
jgi:excisionase family DNA binding protein